MRQPLVLIYETDGRLAALLRRAERGQTWTLREPRRLEACLKLLVRAGPCVLVLKLGRDLPGEFTVLERTATLFPDTATIVVSDQQDPLLTGLAWDLGAAFVLQPPLARELLPDLVAGFLEGQVPLAGDDVTTVAEDDVILLDDE